MDIKEAIEILEQHNKWRRDNEQKYEMTNPTKLGIAIDTVITFHKQSHSIDFKSLRDAFFREHTIKTNKGITEICTNPHNLFEWFKQEILEYK